MSLTTPNSAKPEPMLIIVGITSNFPAWKTVTRLNMFFPYLWKPSPHNLHEVALPFQTLWYQSGFHRLWQVSAIQRHYYPCSILQTYKKKKKKSRSELSWKCWGSLCDFHAASRCVPHPKRMGWTFVLPRMSLHASRHIQEKSQEEASLKLQLAPAQSGDF